MSEFESNIQVNVGKMDPFLDAYDVQREYRAFFFT